MYAFVEEPSRTHCDSSVQSLSWMGKAPDGQPESGTAWRLSENSYYDEGWLASGNSRGVVGVTMTGCRSTQNSSSDLPLRTNFNLRGHRSEVMLVRWNEPYQKLATCDVTGIIFVWIKHDGRWSIELINDRSSQVTDFEWSHDGQMALICYKDSFVLVGSVAGQRYWSSMLNLEGCLVTCGIWTPDDQKVMFGTTAGKVIVMSAGGTMIAQVIIHEGLEITYLGWSSERFFLVDRDTDTTPVANDDLTPLDDGKSYVLSVALAIGDVLLMSNYDDICPKVIHTSLAGIRMEWSNDGELLAVAGYVRLPDHDCRNELRFYRRSSKLQLALVLPTQGRQPVTALTWGHNDRRIFVGVGCDVLTVVVLKRVASLQLLCGRRIQQRLIDESSIFQLPLPNKLQTAITELFAPTIKGYIPRYSHLREFACIPPPHKERLHCTIVRHGDDTSGGYYTLYLEYLGGLIPLLKGKRASKLHPDFIIFDPQAKALPLRLDDEMAVPVNGDVMPCEESDCDVTLPARPTADGASSPSAQRRKRLCKLRDSLKCRDNVDADRTNADADDIYTDNLPEVSRLVEITSNIWGTKFRFTGLASFLPDDLGSVTYKTSLLHLQPRQMTVTIFELTSELRPQAHDPDYNPNQFSESEDEPYAVGYDLDPPCADLGMSCCDRLHGGPRQAADCCSCAVVIDRTLSVAVERNLVLDAQDLMNPSSSLTCTVAHCLPPDCIITADPSTSPLHCSAREPCPARVSPTDPGPFLPTAAAVSMCDSATLHPVLTATNHISVHSTACTMMYVPRAVEDVTGISVSRQPLACSPLPTVADSSASVSPRWADRACEEIQYIDDDCDDKTDLYERQCSARDAVHCSAAGLSAREIMQSTQMLASPTLETSHRSVVQIVRKATSEPTPERGVAQTSPVHAEILVRQRQSSPDARCFACSSAATELAVVASRLPRSFSPTLHKSRSPGAELRHQTAKLREMARNALCHGGRASEHVRRRNGKRRGLCGVARPSVPSHNDEVKSTDSSPHLSNPGSPAAIHRPLSQRCGSLDVRRCESCATVSEVPRPSQSTSLPASPVHRPAVSATRQSAATPLLGRTRLQSPLTGRRRLNVNTNVVNTYVADSSDDELMALSLDEVTTSENYRNLETFQKAQLNKKLRKVRTKCDQQESLCNGGREALLAASSSTSPRHSPLHAASSSTAVCSTNTSPAPASSRRRRFVMYNKAPMWNETSQVYQLDFGGRVTQESAKNFQIEFGGKQVMQFGRIDNNAYTLDFQYPYSAVQAFAVALANVTQRLK